LREGIATPREAVGRSYRRKKIAAQLLRSSVAGTCLPLYLLCDWEFLASKLCCPAIFGSKCSHPDLWSTPKDVFLYAHYSLKRVN